MDNITKFLVDEKKYSKYAIKRLVKVSWNTVHFWYCGIFKPTLEHQKELEEILKLQNARAGKNEQQIN